ncbi:MAG: MBL fold metallo-hydrolase [Betaproteobacteria bacterium]
MPPSPDTAPTHRTAPPQQPAGEAALHFPLGEALPHTGRTLEVAPGLHWVRMALPFALDHINLWLMRDRLDGREGWSIVDCGIDNAATRAAWEQVFAQALQGLPVLRVLVTHMHPDHLGLAHWITERWSTPDHACRLWISSTDWHAAQVAVRGAGGAGGDMAADFFRLHGLTGAEVLEGVRERRGHYASLVPRVPERYRRLMDGQEVVIHDQAWTCLAGYGHAPEHISLHGPLQNVLISGDMVLPRISTNVSVYPSEPEAGALTLFLDSLDRLRALPSGTLVLPSHGRPFTGLHTRIDQLQSHHEARLADAWAACEAKPCSAAELLPVLFKRKLDLHQTTFAMGEAVAHAHALWSRGLVTPLNGSDGIRRWQAVTPRTGADANEA